MKKQIKNLSLHELDFLVAKDEGLDVKIYKDDLGDSCLAKAKEGITWHTYSPTTNPSQAWPIIERDRINITYGDNNSYSWIDGGNGKYGKTSLEAAMRCYVASKFGDEVDMDNLINK